MKMFVTGILAASLTLGAPVLADEHDRYEPSEVQWEVKLFNETGREVGKRRATEAVATVRGPRKLRLSIGCSLDDNRRFIRIEREVENEERAEFADNILDPEVVVRYSGDILFTTERGVLRWQEDEGYYQGRAGPGLTDALRRGNRVVFQDDAEGFKASFQLRGSYNAISKLPCE